MKKILLVDDEPDVLAILKKRLEAEGYAVETAADGIEGLARAASFAPDAILLDVMMPNKDGFSMLSELQADEKLRMTPVIMVTARGETDAIFKGQYLGATDHLIKPVDFQELLKYLRKYTE
ncbi:MAG: response regulator transcription factor [Deltaproteobacteria bacterium]